MSGTSAALAAEVPGASGQQVELYTSGAGSLGKPHRAIWLPKSLAPDSWDVTLGATKDGTPVRWTFSLTESSRRDCRPA